MNDGEASLVVPEGPVLIVGSAGWRQRSRCGDRGSGRGCPLRRPPVLDGMGALGEVRV